MQNIDLLTSISSKFTKETLGIILQKATDAKNTIVTSWEINTSAEDGNFLSVIYRIIITGTVADKVIRVPVIVKALPPNKCYRKTFRSLVFFKNEIAFYSKVLPALQSFIKMKGETDFLSIPKCLAYCHDGENDFLALEDITAQGFQHVFDKKDTWTVEQINVILASLAKFHGTALALQHQNCTEFLAATEDLNEVLFSEEGWEWYRNQFTLRNKIVRTAMSNSYPDTLEEKKFNSLTPYQLFEKCIKARKPRNESPLVVNHGDCWAFNFMTRIKESGEEDGVIFDFQFPLRGSPVFDISFFIYTSTDKDTRDEHFYNFLAYYHSELGKIVTQLGSDIDDVYPETMFMKEVQEFSAAGVVFALDVLPMTLTPKSTFRNLDTNDGDEAIDVVDVWEIDENFSPSSEKRIADIILHAMQQKFFY